MRDTLLPITAKPSICIIGSGPGGGVLAIELAKSGHVEVIVVDVDAIDQEYQQASSIELIAKYTGQPFGLNRTRGFGFGGSSNLWHGLVTQLDDEDWEGIDTLADAKISLEVKDCYRQLNDYFPGVSELFDRRISPSSRNGHLYNELIRTSRFKLKDFYLQKKPLRMRKLLSAAAKKYSNLRFVENSVALYFVSNATYVTEADHLVINQGGNIENIHADYFVVAAGALETPRLCLQSIQNGFSSMQNENIGRYLCDHPWAVIGELVSKNGNFRLSVCDTYATKGLLHRTGLLPKAKLNNTATGTYNNHALALKPLYFGVYTDFKEILKSLISTQLSFAGITKLIMKYQLRDLFGCLVLLLFEKSRIGAYVKRALVFCYLEQTPCSESSVSLTRTFDKYGRVVPEINWVFNEFDLQQASKIKEHILNSFAESKAFYFMQYELKKESFASGSHHAGTMKIGSEKNKGAIDSNLKIFGSDNIYVCDLSIFPKYGNSNPTLTLCAFSVRLSQHLIQRLSQRLGKTALTV